MTEVRLFWLKYAQQAVAPVDFCIEISSNVPAVMDLATTISPLSCLQTDWTMMRAMPPANDAHPVPSTAGFSRGDSVLRDALLDSSRGPKHLYAEPLKTGLSALLMQSSDVTAYPPPPLVGTSRLRDDPLMAVLPRQRPDGVAEALAEAIYIRDEAEVRRLLASGADPNVAPAQGRNA